MCGSSGVRCVSSPLPGGGVRSFLPEAEKLLHSAVVEAWSAAKLTEAPMSTQEGRKRLLAALLPGRPTNCLPAVGLFIFSVSQRQIQRNAWLPVSA